MKFNWTLKIWTLTLIITLIWAGWMERIMFVMFYAAIFMSEQQIDLLKRRIALHKEYEALLKEAE